ncbi:MAG: FHA domain-containing protein, partial [Gammaproteobacteria bacterium]|nr:FHA domain-containing protein [Gammaproteobacteria bacterium]
MEDHFYYLCYLDHQLKLRPGKTYTIGRLDCEITIPSYLVSRRHARIEWQDGRPCLVDLGSTNGTKVNSEKVSKATLSPGDRIEVGNSILKLLRVTENNGAQTMKLSDTVMLEARVATLLHDIKDPELVNKITDLKSLFNKKNQALTKIAYRDSLTKLYNRRYFDSTLFEEVERAKRYHRPLQLILVD